MDPSVAAQQAAMAAAAAVGLRKGGVGVPADRDVADILLQMADPAGRGRHGNPGKKTLGKRKAGKEDGGENSGGSERDGEGNVAGVGDEMAPAAAGEGRVAGSAGGEYASGAGEGTLSQQAAAAAIAAVATSMPMVGMPAMSGAMVMGHGGHGMAEEVGGYGLPQLGVAVSGAEAVAAPVSGAAAASMHGFEGMGLPGLPGIGPSGMHGGGGGAGMMPGTSSGHPAAPADGSGLGGGMGGLPLGMNMHFVAASGAMPAGAAVGLPPGSVLQIADLAKLQGGQTLGIPGVPTLQFVQLPMGAGAGEGHGDVLQQRPLKRSRGDHSGGAGGGGEAADAAAAEAGEHEGADAAAAGDGGGQAEVEQQGVPASEGLVHGHGGTAAAGGGGGGPGVPVSEGGTEMQMDPNAAALQAAGTALGQVVHVNGVNYLIPAPTQLQLSMQPEQLQQHLGDQVLTLGQHQLHLQPINMMGGLPGLAMSGVGVGGVNSNEQIQQLQQQLQLQQLQQIQQMQQMQLLQLQLASAQGGGLVVAAGPQLRLTQLEADQQHLIRRHGALPERVVTREMLREVGCRG